MKNRPNRVLCNITCVTIFTVFLFSTIGPAGALAAPQPAASNPVPANSQVSFTSTPEIEDFHLVSESEGWLLYDQALYWSDTGGQTWQAITPPGPGSLTIAAVTFIDNEQGWLILSGLGADGFPSYILAHTTDRGSTWQATPLQLFQPNDPAAYAGKIYLQFSDPSNGWLMIKQATSSNFDVGALFKTNDGGSTWTRLTVPTGDAVYFLDAQTGWIAGGAAGNEFYQTQDGGQTWAPIKVGDYTGEHPHYQLPVFDDLEHGAVAVTVESAASTRVDIYNTNDGGITWELATTIPVDNGSNGSSPRVALLGAHSWIVVNPNDGDVKSMANGNEVDISPSQADLAAGIVGLDMASQATGWASYASGTCQSGLTPETTCTLEKKLLKTTDSGSTWAMLGLPQISSPGINRANPGSTAPQSTTSPQSLGDWTTVYTGQGFDSCNLPSVKKMQTWFTSSPFKVWNLYIGGSSAAGCGALTATYIAQLAAEGWKFIPTWVGPQASCTAFLSRMSSNANTAKGQGASEADAAMAVAATLGLTGANKTGTIIYYDLEFYDTTNAPCHSAAQAFISGWSGRLHAKGNQAGLYGFAGTATFGDFASLTNSPDGVWLALWGTPAQYRSDASVWIPSYISNSLWVNHQRVRQYAGENYETWGGVQYQIDNNVFDGLVAFTNPAPSLTTLDPPTAAAGGAAFTLTVNGANFISSSVVNWNGNAHPTTYVSATQVTASITAADIATAGPFAVTVTSPLPGGGTTTPLYFLAITNGASINGSITLQGRPIPPDPRWSVPLTVTLTAPGTSAPLYIFNTTTSSRGLFTVTGIQPASYDIQVKNNQTLQNVKKAVTLVSGVNSIDFKTLFEGDADNNNSVTLSDFAILASTATFDLCQDISGYDARADFNGDGCVTLLDFSLLAANYGKCGAIDVDSQGVENPPPSKVATVHVYPDQINAFARIPFTVSIQVQAGSQPVDGAEVVLDFDPAKLQVVQITGNTTLLPQVIQNTFDNVKGTLGYAAGTFTDLPSGTFTLAQVEFLAVGETAGTQLTIHHGTPYDTDVTSGGVSLLGGDTGGSVIIATPQKVFLPQVSR